MIEFQGVEVKLVKGSSSLLSYGVLPVGGERVPKLEEREFTPENDLEREFLDKFGQERIKSGAIRTLAACISKLTNINVQPKAVKEPKPVRAPKDSSVTPRVKVQKEPPAPPVTALFNYNFGFEQSVRDRLTQALLNKPNFYSQQIGISGTGKGTRLSLFLEFLVAMGYEYKYVFFKKDENNPKRAEKKHVALGIYFPEIKMFIMGRWVKSNISRLYSWSSSDTLTSTGYFDYFFGLIQHFCKDGSYLMEGYVAMFSPKFSVEWLQKLGVTNAVKLFFVYNEMEEMLQRVEERQGRRCKGESTWGQNNLTKTRYNRDAEYVQTKAISNDFMVQKLSFNSPELIYGINLLKHIGAPVEVYALFKEFFRKFPTNRHHTDVEGNHERFGGYFHKFSNIEKELKAGHSREDCIILDREGFMATEFLEEAKLAGL